MIRIKTLEEIKLMKSAAQIAIKALMAAGSAAKVGVTTSTLDNIVRKTIEEMGATPSFLGYDGFPASACISINNEVIHGIPSKKTVLKDGDIVSIDVGAYKDGYHGDCARTFAVGNISKEAQKLIDVTRQSFYEGIKFAYEGNRISDISNAIEQYTVSNGFSVVRSFVGHGIGKELHETPEVPNYGKAGRGVRLLNGMALAIEPMVNVGCHEVEVLKDGWTVLTKDRKLSAHYENTIVITDKGPEILTLAPEEV